MMPSNIYVRYILRSFRSGPAAVQFAKYLIGNLPWLEDSGLKLSDFIDKRAEELRNDGQTVMIVATEKEIIALICLADTIKESTKYAVESLIREGIETIMLTGDNQTTAVAVGKNLGITKIFAEVLPQDKADVIKGLQAKSKIVGMAGDWNGRCYAKLGHNTDP